MLNSFVSSLFNLLCFLTQCEKAMCHCWYKCGMLQFFKCSYVGSGNHFTAVNVGIGKVFTLPDLYNSSAESS